MATEMNNDQQMSFGEFLRGAVPWCLIGCAAGLEGSNLALCTVLGPFGERALGFSLEDMMTAYTSAVERERHEREREERLAQIRAALQPLKLESTDTAQAVGPFSLPPLSQPEIATSLKPPLEIEEGSRWRDVVIHPSVVLILGKRGSGKSALGYRLLELFRYQLTPYVLGVPEEARKLLPDWIGIAQSLEEIPQKSIVVLDESYLRFHSRESLKSASREMSQILNLSRQRGQTIIFVSPEARQIDKNIASSANVVVFKSLGILQLEFDRPELSKIATQAKAALDTVKGDKRGWNYIYSPDADFMGLLENSLPSFWSNKLSHVFAAGGETPATKPPKKMTLQERIEKARELDRSGLTLGRIAKILGVSKSTAYNYIKNYPYAR